jgi:hypothetical protein
VNSINDGTNLRVPPNRLWRAVERAVMMTCSSSRGWVMLGVGREAR